jgi:hypothetical protein
MSVETTPVPTETITELDGRTSDLFDLPHDEATMLRLFRVLFEEHLSDIVFGPCIQGAVFEIHAGPPVKLSIMDGYLTIEFDAWHLHLCIGEHRGVQGAPQPDELARHRRVGRAVLFRTRGKSCVPVSWGLRLSNGRGEQMITVFFPNPFLDGHDHRRRDPDWSRLHLWDRIRREFLGHGPDPRDREGHAA